MPSNEYLIDDLEEEIRRLEKQKEQAIDHLRMISMVLLPVAGIVTVEGARTEIRKVIEILNAGTPTSQRESSASDAAEKNTKK